MATDPIIQGVRATCREVEQQTANRQLKILDLNSPKGT